MGPLRRLVGTAGLVAIVPTALLLGTNQLSTVDAAVRGAATFAVVVALGRLLGWWLSATASALERDAEDHEPVATGDTSSATIDDATASQS